MDYYISAGTNIGNTKKTNQDSLFVRKVNTNIGKIVFAGVFDGMGGYSKGEVASASLVDAFSEWFYNKLPALTDKQPQNYEIRAQWEDIIKEQDKKIKEYSAINNLKMGTTAVVMMITEQSYYIMNVGDSRAYEIKETVKQLTEDHSLVQREVREGRLTPQEANRDSRRNILLQCVGGNSNVYPEMFFGDTKEDSVYILCSDGFVHEITSDEIYSTLAPNTISSQSDLENGINNLIDINMIRQETDNISVVAIRTCRRD